jgi:hypothetical protein
MNKKEQIIKQLKFAKKLLLQIQKEHKKENYLRYGKFAFDVQLKEYKRLEKIYKNTVDKIDSSIIWMHDSP